MKFEFFLVVSCIYAVANARNINEEHTFGDIRDKAVYGTYSVQAEMPYKNPMEWYTKYEFTFPEVRNKIPKIREINSEQKFSNALLVLCFSPNRSQQIDAL